MKNTHYCISITVQSYIQHFSRVFYNFSKEELKSFHNSLKKIANYDNSLEKHFEDSINVYY